MPPLPLTEYDLVTKMDHYGIGTDATMHEHIKSIMERGYAVMQGIYIIPKQLGQSLVESYQRLGIDLYKPYIRAKIEHEMKRISEGEIDAE